MHAIEANTLLSCTPKTSGIKQLMTSFKAFLLFLALALILCLQGTLASLTGVVCERLEPSRCAFAVSSSGTRCVLELRARRESQVGPASFSCRASEIEVEDFKDWVETDQCINACGLSRKTVGISSDSFFEPRFTQKLCSPQCYHHCPNIVDLYFNLAVGEGMYLPNICEAKKLKSSGTGRQGMAKAQFSSVVTAAEGPESGSLACAPPQSEQILQASGPAMPPL